MIKATEDFVAKYDSGYFDYPEIENEHTLEKFDSKREVLWKRHGNFSCDGLTFTGREKAASVGWKTIVDSIIEKRPELEPEIEDIVNHHRSTKELGFGYSFKEIKYGN